MATASFPFPPLPSRKDTDGNVRPVSDFNPVNGMASSFDGKPRTEFFGGAMQRDPTRGTGIVRGSNVYGDIRDTLSGKMPKADPRSYGTGGQNFTGPQMPFGMKPTLDATTGQPVPTGMPPASSAKPATGMLVPSSTGGVKWQPGTGPGTTRPPQSKADQMMFGVQQAAPSNGSRIAQSPMNRPYAEMPGGSGSLANRPVRQIGRSANDPQRIAEQMRRRGDPSAILRFGAQQMGQDFAREQNAVNFEQGKMMFGMQQGAMDARDQRNFEQGQMMFGMQQGAMDARDERNFSQQQQLEEQRRLAEQAGQEQARQFGLKPVAAPGTATPYFQDAQGRIYAGSQPEQTPEPMPKGLVPKGYQNGKAIYGTPDAPQDQKFMLRELPGEIVKDPKTGFTSQMPGQMVRVFEDGTFEPIQRRGQPQASAAPAALDPAARLAALRKKAGL